MHRVLLTLPFLERSQTSLDLEHFIHGAHCFSLSGQCSFSSWLGGLSGNRGRCAQPCRRRYHHKGKDGYYFSPNDLSAIELLPELAAAGVMSFKIEGRMKAAMDAVPPAILTAVIAPTVFMQGWAEILAGALTAVAALLRAPLLVVIAVGVGSVVVARAVFT